MKKLILALLLLPLLSATAEAQLNKYTVRCSREGQAVTTSNTASTMKHPQSYPSAAITVYQAGTLTLATLAEDAAGLTPKSNPSVCTAAAEFVFYTAEVSVDYRLAPSGVSPFTVSTVGPNVVGYAATTRAGTTRLSVAPLSATAPNARGTNDPVLYDAKEYASFSAAVTAVCATANTLHVSTVLTVGANTTVPSGCVVRFVGPGQLSVSSGFTVTFAQGSGVVGENRRLFAGSGSISIPSNNYSYEINPRWFAAGAGTFADPYTEWDTRVPWAGWTTYRFPPGYYSYATSPAFSRPGIRLYGAGVATYLIYTGSGAALDFLASSHSPGTWTYGVLMDGFTVQGLNASHGLFAEQTHVSTWKNIIVRNLPGIAFYFRSCHENLLENLTAWEPVGSSLFGNHLPTPTVVPTTGLKFDEGIQEPLTNNTFTIKNLSLAYINGRGVDIESLLSSKFDGGAVELCVQEGFVIRGSQSETNAVSIVATEIEHNNGSGSDVYTNAHNITLRDLFAFNGTISVDSGAQNVLLEGGTYDTINILTGALDTSLRDLQYDYSGSGGLSDDGTRTSIGPGVIHKGTALPYQYSSKSVTPKRVLAGGTVQSNTTVTGAFTYGAVGIALSNDAISAAAKWKLIFEGTFYDTTLGSGAVHAAPYLELTSEKPSVDLGGGVSLTATQEVGGNRLIKVTAAGATTVAFAGTVRQIVNSEGTAGPDSINVKANVKSAGQIVSAEYDAGNSGAAKTLDFNNGNTQFLTLTGNCTLTLSNPLPGGRYVLHLLQDATGSRTVTWPAAVTWAGGAAPTLTTTAGKVDVITLVYSGVSGKYRGEAALNF